MQVNISTRHGHLSEASQAKLRGKAEKLNRYFDRLASIEVVVDLKDSQNPIVDCKVSAEHKHDFVARHQSDSLHGAFDSAIEKIEQQLRKYKERVQERRRNQSSKRLDATAGTAVGEVDEQEPDLESS